MKNVKVQGVEWSVLSTNERITEYLGRHFILSRCKPGSPWYLREHDCNIKESATGAKEIGYYQYKVPTTIIASNIVKTNPVLMSREAYREPLALLCEPMPQSVYELLV